MSAASQLAAVELAIEYRLGRIAAGDFLEYAFADKRMKDYDLESLYRIRTKLKNEIANSSGKRGWRLQRMSAGGSTE